MKQTAVDWLVEQYKKVGGISISMAEIAKEMEKKQVIEAHFHGCERGEMFNNENRAFITDSEQYYNQTFKQEEQ
jgi:hypothetical protein